MAVTVKRMMKDSQTSLTESRDSIDITEIYVINGDASDNMEYPAYAKDAVGLPDILDAHGEIASCKVIGRDINNFSPTGCIATIKYSNRASAIIIPDSSIVLTLDMLGKTERQIWDISDETKAIGAVGEGVEVYRPHLTITYDCRLSVLPAAVYNLTGTINKFVYKGYPSNSLLYMGCRARKQGSSNYDCSFQFLYDPALHVVAWKTRSTEINPVSGEEEPKLSITFYADVYPEEDFTALPL